jgi:predicted DNA-binding transcriptional regulator YafY
MARKRTKQESHPQELARLAITPERFVRLYRLLGELAEGPRARSPLLKALDLDVRGFYRDLETLRSVGVQVTLREGLYHLEGDAEAARARLPFPDVRLTLAEARSLAKGRSVLQRWLQDQINGWTA